MSYVALKPCTFAGKKFMIGDEIPPKLVLAGSRENLVKMGIIAAKGESAYIVSQASAAHTVEIKLHSAAGDSVLEVGLEDLQAIFDALSQKATDAEAVVKALTSVNALVLLSECDARKTIKELAKARITALAEEATKAEETTEAEAVKEETVKKETTEAGE